MSHYFRLFDIEKYRSIQSIVEKINDRKASVSEATFLVGKALSIAETDEFNKYNDEGEYGNLTHRILLRIQDLIQEGRLEELPDIESDDMLRTIILVICCPRFQLMTSIHVKEISDTCADYTYVGYMDSLNEELVDILDIHEYDIYPLETIPSSNGRMGVFDREQLIKIQSMVVENIMTLSDKKYDYLKKASKDLERNLSDNILHMADVIAYTNLVEFHKQLEIILKLANSQSYYTIISEYLV
jgi:hypothetical protein